MIRAGFDSIKELLVSGDAWEIGGNVVFFWIGGVGGENLVFGSFGGGGETNNLIERVGLPVGILGFGKEAEHLVVVRIVSIDDNILVSTIKSIVIIGENPAGNIILLIKIIV